MPAPNPGTQPGTNPQPPPPVSPAPEVPRLHTTPDAMQSPIPAPTVPSIDMDRYNAFLAFEASQKTANAPKPELTEAEKKQKRHEAMTLAFGPDYVEVEQEQTDGATGKKYMETAVFTKTTWDNWNDPNKGGWKQKIAVPKEYTDPQA